MWFCISELTHLKTVCLSVCLSFFMFVYLSVCLSRGLSVYLWVCLWVCWSVKNPSRLSWKQKIVNWVYSRWCFQRKWITRSLNALCDSSSLNHSSNTLSWSVCLSVCLSSIHVFDQATEKIPAKAQPAEALSYSSTWPLISFDQDVDWRSLFVWAVQTVCLCVCWLLICVCAHV